ncbi:hypothetical protein [Novosphingobium cyanobacteriorum]|uniref:Glycoside hydrolase n=1 Tax=Novosphingobium cyanobacteriorum TaxID=3024215 RepID=A0ABT6CHI2_9SPHN|nr:hypothetical protein [Novosphingobium cyanobacteriorum]MDF8333384.1 hypothetical protein [Novosphingobium cyanobacteriorum]
MMLTFIGAIQVLLGLALFLIGSVEAMFGFMLVSAMFGGSAALTLPALGGSSIPPVQFALVFMALRLFVPGAGQMNAVGEAARANVYLVLFVLWGAVLAFIAPRIFAGQVDVTPLRGRTEARYISEKAYLYATRPLAPSPQNITTAVYMFGTLLAGIAAHVSSRTERGRATLVRTMAVVGMLHALIGFTSVAAKGTPIADVLNIFRNANYAQLDHSWKGFVRMTGIWPEASSYAAFAMTWFVFNFECWLRRVDGRFTGPAALLLAMALVFSTASTAYVGLPIYFAFVIMRMLLFPGAVTADRVLWIGAAVLILVVVACTVMLAQPSFADSFVGLIRRMTVEKQDSFSGLQRKFWAWQGIDAFLKTGGIGIGPGSFRSSSLATAVLGSTGILGAAALLTHFLFAFKPHRLSTYAPSQSLSLSTGAACAWAMLMGVLIASIAAPSCDPGTDFGILAGAALALRGRPVLATSLRWRVPAPQQVLSPA